MDLVFPDPLRTGPDGIVLMGGAPAAQNLKAAYAKGIFPWPHEGVPLLWFSPPHRGVLKFDEIHLARSLRKTLLRNPFEVRWDTCFEEVMRSCALSPRRDSHGTWITPEMVEGYLEAHRQGWAHSVEIFEKGKLVGGIYGVRSESYFSAESMFYKVSSASKVALVFLLMELKRAGHRWLDTQMITPVTEAMGGRYIPRDEFQALLKVPVKGPLPFQGLPRTGELTEEELRWIGNL